MNKTDLSNGNGTDTNGIPRLTRRQLAVIHEFAQGHDIATVAKRRGCGLSATYELSGRICDRLGLAKWQEIGPWAVESGLARAATS